VTGAWLRVPPFVGLVAVWLLLMGEVTLGNVLGGVVVAAVVVGLVPLARPSTGHVLHPLALARLTVFVAWSLVTSSWAVLVTTLAPTPERLRAGIVRVDLPPSSSEWVTTVVANAITLTPGTMTLTATMGPPMLQVHVLGLGDIDEFRDEILDLHRRVDAAFTPRGVAA
jgi:multicomponent Na+:H+ antiporter subunit E